MMVTEISVGDVGEVTMDDLRLLIKLQNAKIEDYESALKTIRYACTKAYASLVSLPNHARSNQTDSYARAMMSVSQAADRALSNNE